MCRKVVFLIVILFSSLSLLSQKSFSKNELTSLQKLYGIALDSFVERKPSHFVLVDSSENAAIKEFNFSGLANNSHLDSSWANFLILADSKKGSLQKIKFGKIKTIHTVRYFNRDTILKIQRNSHDVGSGIVPPYGWVDGVMTISTPIFSTKKDKAIIEISYTRDELDGKGGVILLEKRNKKWVIVKYIRTWVA